MKYKGNLSALVEQTVTDRITLYNPSTWVIALWLKGQTTSKGVSL